MNKQETAEAIKVMQAYVDGDEVEARFRTGIAFDMGWQPATGPEWHYGICDYRIKSKIPREFWMANTGDEFVKVILATDGGWIEHPEKWIRVREVLDETM